MMQMTSEHENGGDLRPRFLADENFNGDIQTGLQQHYPEIDIIRAQEVVPEGTSDTELLEVMTRLDRLLLTHDRRTIPGFYAALLAKYLPIGKHMPGVVIISDDLPVGAAIEEIATLWGASTVDEWYDRLLFIP